MFSRAIKSYKGFELPMAIAHSFLLDGHLGPVLQLLCAVNHSHGFTSGYTFQNTVTPLLFIAHGAVYDKN